MVKIFVPDESATKLKWAGEKSAIYSFLTEYCRHRFPDNPEYSERYHGYHDKWVNEYKNIIENGQRSFQGDRSK